jgi:hypothetical protein
MSDEKDTTFKVSDRRKFNPDGTMRDQSDGTAEPVAVSPVEEVEEVKEEPPIDQPDNVISFPGDAASKRESAESKPSINAASDESAPEQPATRQAPSAPNELFISLLNMLGVEAAMYLGLIESPGEHQIPVDLEAAKRMIELLAVLQEKTAGNLAQQEAAMLEAVLSDLRMQFVAMSRKR